MRVHALGSCEYAQLGSDEDSRRVLFRVEEEKWPEYHVFKAIYAMRTGLMLPRVAFLKLLSSGDDAIVVRLHVMRKTKCIESLQFCREIERAQRSASSFFLSQFSPLFTRLQSCNFAKFTRPLSKQNA